MHVEAGIEGMAAISFTTPAGLSDKNHVTQSRVGTKSPGHFQSTHSRQADVDQRNVRNEVAGNIERGRAIVCDPHIVSPQLYPTRSARIAPRHASKSTALFLKLKISAQ